MFQIAMSFGPWVVAGAVMWLFAYLLGPYGYEVRFMRAIGAVVLCRLAELLIDSCTYPYVGAWRLLAYLVAFVLVTKAILWLPFWRATAVGTAYFVALRGSL